MLIGSRQARLRTSTPIGCTPSGTLATNSPVSGYHLFDTGGKGFMRGLDFEPSWAQPAPLCGRFLQTDKTET